MKRSFLLSFMLLVFCAIASTAQSPNVAGTWDASLTSPLGTRTVQLVLKQDGEKLSGVVKGPNAEIPVEGTASGKEIKLKYTVQYQGNDMLITLNGALDGATIKGRADYGGMADGEFNAKRAGEGGAAATTASTPPATASAGANITGAWNFDVETPAGAGTPGFTFKQEGEKLSGQYKGAFGEAPLTGTVKGDKVEFSLKVSGQGQELTIKYTGTIEKDGSMKGTVDLGEVGSGTWTATRQK